MPAKKKATKAAAKPKKAATKRPASRAKKMKEKPQLLRGMKDILPEDQAYRMAVQQRLEAVATAYGYYRLDTPIVEQASLFLRTLGEDTDVVSKEMYTFEDKSGDEVALRPEFTAAIARAYVEHGMLNKVQPVKLYTSGPLFRHDRPQAGRYRQFHQLDVEIIGGRTAMIDAEIIAVAYSVLKDLGLKSTVRINSIGSKDDRKKYVDELVAYLKSKKRQLSEESQARIKTNPLRVLDSKDEGDRAVIAEAPQIIDWLSDDSKNYFMSVLEYLDDTGIPYELEPTLVRGLDYYNDIVFELYEDGADAKAQSALAGGGRYDGLIEYLGGQPTGASGFAMGIERVINAMKANDVQVPGMPTPDVFLAQIGKTAQKYSLGLMEELRTEGFNVRANLTKGQLSAQLKVANKLQVPYTLILGQKELLDGTIILRDMDGGSQEHVDIKKVVKELKKRIERNIRPVESVMVGKRETLPEEDEVEEEVQDTDSDSKKDDSKNSKK